MHRSEFLKELKEKFPDLTNDINQEYGQLHFEVNVMRKRAQKAIYDGDRKSLDLLFNLASIGYEKGNSDLKDAIDVSFVEPLEFKETKKNNYKWAWESMPETLKQLYLAFHGKVRM